MQIRIREWCKRKETTKYSRHYPIVPEVMLYAVSPVAAAIQYLLEWYYSVRMNTKIAGSIHRICSLIYR